MFDVAIDFKDGDVDDDFGAGTIEVVKELLREEELVGRGAHDDGVLAGDEVDLDAGVKQIADGDDDFIGVVLLAGVGEIEGLDGLLVEVGALGARVGSDEDGVRRDGLVEGAGDGADDAEGVCEGDVGEVDGDALGAVVGIEEDVEAGCFADGVIDYLDVFDHVERDGIVRDGLEFYGAGDGSDRAEGLILLRHLLFSLRSAVAFDLLLFLNGIDLLRGCLVAGIDLLCAGELGECAVDISALAKDSAAIDVRDGGLIPHVVEVLSEAEVFGLFEDGVVIVLVGCVKVLARLGVLTTLVPGVS